MVLVKQDDDSCCVGRVETGSLQCSQEKSIGRAVFVQARIGSHHSNRPVVVAVVGEAVGVARSQEHEAALADCGLDFVLVGLAEVGDVIARGKGHLLPEGTRPEPGLQEQVGLGGGELGLVPEEAEVSFAHSVPVGVQDTDHENVVGVVLAVPLGKLHV